MCRWGVRTCEEDVWTGKRGKRNVGWWKSKSQVGFYKKFCLYFEIAFSFLDNYPTHPCLLLHCSCHHILYCFSFRRRLVVGGWRMANIDLGGFRIVERSFWIIATGWLGRSRMVGINGLVWERKSQGVLDLSVCPLRCLSRFPKCAVL